MKHLTGVLCLVLAPAAQIMAQEPILRATLKGHAEPVWCVALSSDGKLLASGSKDGTVKLWDVTTGKEKTTLKASMVPVHSVSLSGDSKLLATGGGIAYPQVCKSLLAA